MFGWRKTFEAARLRIPAIPLKAIKVEPISFATDERSREVTDDITTSASQRPE
jgi:hypothetical protein